LPLAAAERCVFGISGVPPLTNLPSCGIPDVGGLVNPRIFEKAARSVALLQSLAMHGTLCHAIAARICMFAVLAL